MINNAKIVDELRRIAKNHHGLLRPEDVVEEARPKNSPLHNSFIWDDSSAAHQWRLHQARNLIRVTVQYIQCGKNKEPVRVFVSLTPDREDGGGYRDTVAVLSNVSMRAQLLSDAFDEMEVFQQKYRSLKELSKVFEAMRNTRKRMRRK